MQFLVFILAYPFLWFISKLPYSLFYGFSDVLFFLLYHLVGYRKKVVWDNLKLVFPEKSDDELKSIQRKSYQHLCDLFLEMVKTRDLGTQEIQERYKVLDAEYIRELERTKSIIFACAHYANWEWNVSMSNYFDSKAYATYQKIGNPYFDSLVKKIRGKWGTIPINQKETMTTVVRNHKNKVPAIYGIVNDQSPQAHLAQYWTKFMGITVPVFTGVENLARKLDLAVVFLKVSKVKRGYYQAEFIPITTGGKSTDQNEITDTFLRLVEQQIRERPEHYLWTHRRWKHRDKVPKGLN